MDKKALTLVEIMIVVTILAILGLISFIYLQGFTIDTRDAKRISDVEGLFRKITIENGMGVDYSQIINAPERTILKINGEENKEGYQSIEAPINWKILKESGDNFKDPTNGHPYPFAYAEGNANGIGYSFIQLAYVEEKTGVTRLVGNYYEMEPGDSPSLFKGCIGEGNENEIIKDGSCPIYDIGVTYEPSVLNCEEVSDFNGLGYNLEFTINGSTTISTRNVDHGTKEATFKCYNGSFSIVVGSEKIKECESGYNSNGNECTLFIPESCPAGQYLNGTNCENVGYNNYSGEGEKEIHSCPDGGITETTTASLITECKKLNQACKGLPDTTAYEWYTETITQTHNGTSYQPNLEGAYSANAVSGECKYKCSTNYTWDNDICNKNCSTTTSNGYSVPTTNGGITTTVLTKTGSITGGVQAIQTTFTCNNGTFKQNTETIINVTCNTNYTKQANNTCTITGPSRGGSVTLYKGKYRSILVGTYARNNAVSSCNNGFRLPSMDELCGGSSRTSGTCSTHASINSDLNLGSKRYWSSTPDERNIAARVQSMGTGTASNVASSVYVVCVRD